MDIARPYRAAISDRRLTLGDAVILADLRRIEGPGGTPVLEPRVMRVLMTLASTPGTLVTRERLLDECWDGVIVGDDALTRAIAAIRRALREAGVRGLAVETLSKGGYRLIVDPFTDAALVPAMEPAPAAPPLAPARQGAAGASRRLLLGGGALALAGAGALAWRQLAAPDPAAVKVAALIARARDNWRLGRLDQVADGVSAAEEAVALAPDNADAWGMLALQQRERSESAAPEQAQPALDRCQAAIARALAIDAGQGEALAARAMIAPLFGDWAGARRRLDAVLGTVPDQPVARDALGLLHGSTGLMAEALGISLAQAEADPLAAVYQHKLVYRLWAAGRLQDMDRTADRALALWPAHPAVWMARMWTYGYTGRTEAALRMLEGPGVGAIMPPPMLALFRATMTALGSRRPADIDAAIAANRGLATRGVGPAVAAIQHLAALGDVDRAMAVTRGFLTGGGAAAALSAHDPRYAASLNQQHRRKTLMLWVPATASLRAHPGFLPLMAEIGMAEYWARVGVKPDFLARG